MSGSGRDTRTNPSFGDTMYPSRWWYEAPFTVIGTPDLDDARILSSQTILNR